MTTLQKFALIMFAAGQGAIVYGVTKDTFLAYFIFNFAIAALAVVGFLLALTDDVKTEKAKKEEKQHGLD